MIYLITGWSIVTKLTKTLRVVSHLKATTYTASVRFFSHKHNEKLRVCSYICTLLYRIIWTKSKQNFKDFPRNLIIGWAFKDGVATIADPIDIVSYNDGNIFCFKRNYLNGHSLSVCTYSLLNISETKTWSLGRTTT